MANGHPDAMNYHIARVTDEAWMVLQHQNTKLIRLAGVIQAATSTTGMTASKAASREFNKFIKELAGDQ